MTTRPRAQALGGLVVGAVVLILVTAIITAAVSSARAEAGLHNVVGQLQAIADQQDATADRLVTQQRTDAKQQTSTLAARKRLLAQNAELQRQIRALTNFLRAHGINVPKAVTTPRTEPSTRGKAPRPTSPGTPTPTGPNPSGPDQNMACQLVPALCLFVVPTLLPKELR